MPFTFDVNDPHVLCQLRYSHHVCSSLFSFLPFFSTSFPDLPLRHLHLEYLLPFIDLIYISYFLYFLFHLSSLVFHEQHSRLGLIRRTSSLFTLRRIGFFTTLFSTIAFIWFSFSAFCFGSARSRTTERERKALSGRTASGKMTHSINCISPTHLPLYKLLYM